MTFKSHICVLVSFFCVILSVQSQETRISKKKVPENIQQHISSKYPDAKKIKYYHSVENDTVFIECDFKSGIDGYSLLFSPDGKLYETEIIVKFSELPNDIQTKINADLSNRFKKFKIQECYEVNPQSNALYEINVYGVTDRSDDSYEVFFDKQGNFVKIKKNIIKPISTVF